MDQFEKVEKLRERASVTYEEAKNALEESGWDLLDAMVLLEKKGKTEGPKRSNFSTSYEQQDEYISVKKTVEEKQKKGRGLGDLFRSFIRVCRDNFLSVSRKDEEVIRIPVSLLVLILLFFWKFAIPVMIVGLFLGFRYGFEGKDELKTANKIMDSAKDVAEYVKREFSDARTREEGGAVAEAMTEAETSGEDSAEEAAEPAAEEKKAETFDDLFAKKETEAE